MTAPILCIYHGNCADGFTAAWVVREYYGDKLVDFFPGVYQAPPPDVAERQHLIFVDFTYKRPVLLDLAEQVQTITILDHHATAADDLRDLPANVRTTFDMGRSGARLTWDHYFPKEKPPAMLLHVEDRDLWRFNMPYSREIMAAIFSYPYDFKVWDKLMNDAPQNYIMVGEAIERKHHKDVAELLAVSTRYMAIGGYYVPVANLPYTYSSDAGMKLAKGEPFAACYWDSTDGRNFSLRSVEDGGLDVSKIARQYGGGGHKHAAGFKVPLQTLAERGLL